MKRELDGMVGTEWQVGEISPYGVDKAREIIKWIKEYDGVGKYYVDDIFGQYYFEDEGDRMMFILRWA